tara:strand:- start:351 stop:827 length:477 start_codon:yes stop_codon:yes gene_type:complete
MVRQTGDGPQTPKLDFVPGKYPDTPANPTPPANENDGHAVAVLLPIGVDNIGQGEVPTNDTFALSPTTPSDRATEYTPFANAANPAAQTAQQRPAFAPVPHWLVAAHQFSPPAAPGPNRVPNPRHPAAAAAAALPLHQMHHVAGAAPLHTGHNNGITT